MEEGKEVLEKPLISVIVPIYNVQKYVRKCLDSLKNQTLKQIEVICIDDGSTDSSGAIADEYVSDGWPWFIVTHTENRGLSAARNRGIDEARADWLMFVDSDDWVEDQFCEIPYQAAVEENADMVIFQNYNATECGKVKRAKPKTPQIGLIDHETAVDVGWTAVWNRLYKKELFDGIRYPEGHVYEDYAITHRLVNRASRVFSVVDYLYYYRYRRGSICHSIAGEADRLEMSKIRCRDLIDLGYPEEKAKVQLIGAALRCCGRADRDSPEYKEASRILDEYKDTLPELLDKEKKMMTIWKIDKCVYNVLYKGYIRMWNDIV